MITHVSIKEITIGHVPVPGMHNGNGASLRLARRPLKLQFPLESGPTASGPTLGPSVVGTSRGRHRISVPRRALGAGRRGHITPSQQATGNRRLPHKALLPCPAPAGPSPVTPPTDVSFSPLSSPIPGTDGAV